MSADLTPSGGAFGMHARESGTRARPTFCFTSLAIQLSVSAGQRVALLVDLYPRRRHVKYGCQRVGKASALKHYCCLSFLRSDFTNSVDEGKPGSESL